MHHTSEPQIILMGDVFTDKESHTNSTEQVGPLLWGVETLGENV
jgi:hypothetical protein